MLSRKKATQRNLLIVLAGLVVLLLLTRPEKAPELRQAAALHVTAAAVRTHDLVPHETVSGRLEPMRKTLLHFELSGQMRERRVEPGQVVEADALLLALVAGDFQDALDSAEARLQLESGNIERDRELLKLAERNRQLQKNEVNRLETLGKDSLISKSRLDEARIKLLQLESEVTELNNSVDTAAARLGLLQAERNRAARDLLRTRLHAPFAGIVNAVEVQVGDYVTPNEAVLELIDISGLDLYVEVRGELAQALSQGQEVNIQANGHTLAGRIVALQTDPDPVTFTHALRVRLPGARVRSGMVAQVQLPLNPLEQVIAVPVTAVLQDEGRSYVFRVMNDVLQRTEVIAGRRVGDLQVLQSGLGVDDVIVVRDVAALSDGQQVGVMQ
ncbi:MAG: efflux RND transporter periplasmic adaptor subunit [Gammaproteobacteria bacterium]|nr:efflux RND transporter periplasmic adaptor subunit [Gammaproteobacteria bacterium]